MTRIERTARLTFRSLSIRNYRIYFWAQVVSTSGTWMQAVAQSWLVLKLTHNNGVALGFTTALQFLPTFLAGMWGGVVADRFDRRKILILSQGLAGVLALVLGVLTATHVVVLWHVYLLALLLGWVTVIDTPARQTFVIELVGPDELPNAVALNAASFNAGRIIGPAIAAALIASAGIAPSFLINGVSYAAVVIALLSMHTDALHRQAAVPRSHGQVREGLRYIWHERLLRDTVVLVAIVATFGYNFIVVLPLMAKLTFHGGAGAYGLLTSVMSGGALVGALAAAARRGPSLRYLLTTSAAFGVLALGLAVAPNLAIAAVLIVPMGAASMAFISTANAMLQLNSASFMRGRVMALWSVVLLGGTAIGGPLAGWTSRALGPRYGLGIGAGISLLASLLALGVRDRTRRRAAEAAVALRDEDLLALGDTRSA